MSFKDEVTGVKETVLPFARWCGGVREVNPLIYIANMLTIAANSATRARPMGLLRTTARAPASESPAPQSQAGSNVSTYDYGNIGTEELFTRLVDLIRRSPKVEFVKRGNVDNSYFSATTPTNPAMALIPPMDSVAANDLKTAHMFRQTVNMARKSKSDSRNGSQLVLHAINASKLAPVSGSDLFSVAAQVGAHMNQVAFRVKAEKGIVGTEGDAQYIPGAVTWLDAIGSPTHNACIRFAVFLLMLDFPNLDARPLFIRADDEELEGHRLNTPEGRQREEDATVNRLYVMMQTYYAQLPKLIYGIRAKLFAHKLASVNDTTKEWMNKYASAYSAYATHPIVTSVIDAYSRVVMKFPKGDATYLLPPNAFRFALAAGPELPETMPEVGSYPAHQARKAVKTSYVVGQITSASRAVMQKNLFSVLEPPSQGEITNKMVADLDPFTALMEKAARFKTDEIEALLGVSDDSSREQSRSGALLTGEGSQRGVVDGPSAIALIRLLKHMRRVTKLLEDELKYSKAASDTALNWGGRSSVVPTLAVDASPTTLKFNWTDGDSTTGDPRATVLGFTPLVPISLIWMRSPRTIQIMIAPQASSIFCVDVEDDDTNNGAPRGFRSHFMPVSAWLGEQRATRMTIASIRQVADRIFELPSDALTNILLRRAVAPTMLDNRPFNGSEEELRVLPASWSVPLWIPQAQNNEYVFSDLARLETAGRKEGTLTTLTVRHRAVEDARKELGYIELPIADATEEKLKNMSLSEARLFSEIDSMEVFASGEFDDAGIDGLRPFLRRIVLDVSMSLPTSIIPLKTPEKAYAPTNPMPTYERDVGPEVPQALNSDLSSVTREVISLLLGPMAMAE